jgi:hypothetical protein
MDMEVSNINLEALQKVYEARKQPGEGDTFVVLEWQNLEKLHKIFLHLNRQFQKLFDQAYEPYLDNLHITIIGLEQYRTLASQDREMVNAFLEDFPSIELQRASFKLLENGLLVSEIELTRKSVDKLVCFRKGLEIFGIKYKYPDKISNLHSVLGIINPQYFDFDFFQQHRKKITTILKDANKCANFRNKPLSISVENTLRVRYTLTSLHNLDNFFERKIEEYVTGIFIDETMNAEEIYKSSKRELNRIRDLLKRSNHIEILGKKIKAYKQEFISDHKLQEDVFWRKIDLQLLYEYSLDAEEYNFSHYRFPSFIDRSFLAIQNEKGHMVFRKPIIFLKSHFVGKVFFVKAIFEQKASFNIAYFYEKVQIRSCRFLGETYFRKTYFFKEADFEASHFKNVALDGITFPENNKIKMVRTTFDMVIWSNFINPNDVLKIESERETFARLKQANSERGNFIDSNLFFVEESNIYLKNIKEKLFCIPKKDRAQEDPNKKCPKWIKKLGFLGDYISFGIAKITSNFGKSWFIPLAWFWGLFFIALFVFVPNRDYIATPGTPKFLMETDESKIPVSRIADIENAYFRKNYYEGYNFEFQDDSQMKLKDTFATRSMYVFGSLAPTVLASNQWFSTIQQDRFMMRAILTILFWYFLGAFLYALKNRTKRN